MKKGEIPNNRFEIVPFSENVDDFVIKIFILEHPINVICLEYLIVENVFILKERDDFVLVSRAKDIFE